MAIAVKYSARSLTSCAASVAMLLLGMSTATAEIVFLSAQYGSQGLVDIGVATAGPTNDVNDASVFSLSALISTEESHGYFAGLPMQFFGTVTFNVADPLSLRFGTPEFGTFASTNIRQLSNDTLVGSRSFAVDGMYTKGTFGGPLVPNPSVTNFTISFNQNAGTGASISVNATLDFSAIQPVPEPSAIALATAAAATAGLVRLRRGRSRAATSGLRRQG